MENSFKYRPGLALQCNRDLLYIWAASFKWQIKINIVMKVSCHCHCHGSQICIYLFIYILYFILYQIWLSYPVMLLWRSLISDTAMECHGGVLDRAGQGWTGLDRNVLKLFYIFNWGNPPQACLLQGSKGLYSGRKFIFSQSVSFSGPIFSLAFSGIKMLMTFLSRAKVNYFTIKPQ